jgi:hypothetical protein
VTRWLVQVYKAERSAEPLRVYNLRYDDSAETDQFSAGLARERRSLESLIADKAHMVLPANPDPTQVCAAIVVPMQLMQRPTSHHAGGCAGTETHCILLSSHANMALPNG